MSKCKAVQDEMKINQISVKRKDGDAVVEKKEIKSSSCEDSQKITTR